MCLEIRFAFVLTKFLERKPQLLERGRAMVGWRSYVEFASKRMGSSIVLTVRTTLVADDYLKVLYASDYIYG